MLALLIVACVAVLADAWTTRRALLASSTESNPIRRFFIRVLGLNGGTFGVAVAICVTLAAMYHYSVRDQMLAFWLVLVASAYTYVAWNNYQKVK